jgi:hypothetical protein
MHLERRHFEMLAAMVRELRERGQDTDNLDYLEAVGDLEDLCVSQGQRTNERFDEQRFRKACKP